jgi:L-galactose dehydrogenase
MGLLGSKPVPDWHPAPPNVREAALQVRGMCRLYGIEPGTLALHICLNHADMASTFVGISSAEEVAAAVAALDLRPPEDLMQSIRRIIEPVHNIVWPSGLDENRI